MKNHNSKMENLSLRVPPVAGRGNLSLKMRLLRSARNDSFIRIITLVVSIVFFCQNIAIADLSLERATGEQRPATNNALAPKTVFQKERMYLDKGKIEYVVEFLSKNLNVTTELVREAIYHFHIKKRFRQPLINELCYLIRSNILTAAEIQKFESMPLNTIVKALLLLAFKAEHMNPWSVEITARPDENWPGLKVEEIVQKDGMPDAEILEAVGRVFKITPYSAENFFSHPFLQKIPPEAKERIYNICRSHPDFNIPKYFDALALLFLNPFLSSKVADMVETRAGIPGVIKLVNRIKDIGPGEYDDYKSSVGFLTELEHIEQTFLADGYEIAEMDVDIVNAKGERITECDVVAVKNGELDLGEVKLITFGARYERFNDISKPAVGDEKEKLISILKKRFYLLDTEIDSISFDKPVEQILHEVWFEQNVKNTVEVIVNNDRAGELSPFLFKYGFNKLSGLIFSICTNDDVRLETYVRYAAAELARKSGIDIKVRFVPRPQYPLSIFTKDRLVSHSQRAPYALTPERYLTLKKAISEKNYFREGFESFQRQLKCQYNIDAGIETLKILLQQADNDYAGLARLIKRKGLLPLLRMSYETPLSVTLDISKGKRRPRSRVLSAGSLNVRGSVCGSKYEDLPFEINPYIFGRLSAVHILPEDINSLRDYFGSFPDSYLYGEAKNLIWTVLFLDTRVQHKGTWPLNPFDLVQRSGGRINFNGDFFNSLDGGSRQILMIEEALFELRYRKHPLAGKLIHDFQERYAGKLNEISEKVKIYRENLGLKRQKSSTRAIHHRRLTALENSLKKIIRRLSPVQINKVKTDFEDISDDLARCRRLINRDPWNPDLTRHVLAKIKFAIGEMAISARPDLARNEAEVKEEAVSAYSMDRLLTGAEKADLDKCVQDMSKLGKFLDIAFFMVAKIYPDMCSAIPVFDLSLAESFRKNLSYKSARRLIIKYKKMSKLGLAVIKQILAYTFAEAEARGYPIDKAGRPDIKAAKALIGKLATGRTTKELSRRVQGLSDKWPGEEKFLELYSTIEKRRNEKQPGADVSLCTLLIPSIFIKLFEIDEDKAGDPENLKMSDINVLSLMDKKIKSLENLTREKERLSRYYDRWVKEGYNVEEKEAVEQWCRQGFESANIAKERMPFLNIQNKSLFNEMGRISEFIKSLPGRTYSIKLGGEVLDCLKRLRQIKKSFGLILIEQLKPIMSRVEKADLSGEMGMPARFAAVSASLSAISRGEERYNASASDVADIINRYLRAIKITDPNALKNHYKATEKAPPEQFASAVEKDLILVSTHLALWDIYKVTINDQGSLVFHTKEIGDVDDALENMYNMLVKGELPQTQNRPKPAPVKTGELEEMERAL